MSRFPENADTQPNLLIFARYPRLGSVKTRLAGETTDEFAFHLYSRMLLDTLDRLAVFHNPKTVYFEGCSLDQAHKYLDTNHLGTVYSTRIQNGSDLGEKMWNACLDSEVLHNGHVFAGTDSPNVPLSEIQTAFDNLKAGICSIGPALDGGYYLLAIRGCRKDFFKGIPWGSERVLESTTRRIRTIPYRLLRQWYDVDSFEDVIRLSRDLQNRFPGFPRRTADFLNRSGLF
jgi:rSAM/selenodomain-associated transferase 1